MTYFAALQRRVTQPWQNPMAVSKEDVQHVGGPLLNGIAEGVPKPFPTDPGVLAGALLWQFSQHDLLTVLSSPNFRLLPELHASLSSSAEENKSRIPYLCYINTLKIQGVWPCSFMAPYCNFSQNSEARIPAGSQSNSCCNPQG